MKSYFLSRSVVSLFLVWAEASLTRSAVRVPRACLQLLTGEHFHVLCDSFPQVPEVCP